MKNVDFKTPEEFHTKLGMIFNAAIALPLLPFVILFLEIKDREFEGIIDHDFLAVGLSYGIPALSGLLVLNGFKLVDAKRKEASNIDDLKGKLLTYYQGVSKMYLLVGFASILMALGLWFTSSGVIIVAYVILLFVMSLYRPTPKRYVKDLNLIEEEKEIILNKKDHQL